MNEHDIMELNSSVGPVARDSHPYWQAHRLSRLLGNSTQWHVSTFDLAAIMTKYIIIFQSSKTVT